MRRTLIALAIAMAFVSGCTPQEFRLGGDFHLGAVQPPSNPSCFELSEGQAEKGLRVSVTQGVETQTKVFVLTSGYEDGARLSTEEGGEFVFTAPQGGVEQNPVTIDFWFGLSKKTYNLVYVGRGQNDEHPERKLYCFVLYE